MASIKAGKAIEVSTALWIRELMAQFAESAGFKVVQVATMQDTYTKVGHEVRTSWASNKLAGCTVMKGKSVVLDLQGMAGQKLQKLQRALGVSCKAAGNEWVWSCKADMLGKSKAELQAAGLKRFKVMADKPAAPKPAAPKGSKAAAPKPAAPKPAGPTIAERQAARDLQALAEMP